MSEGWGWGLQEQGCRGLGFQQTPAWPEERQMAAVPVVPQPGLRLAPGFSISSVPSSPAPNVLHRNATPESRKHPEADVASTFHPGLILNCAVFLSKQSGHLPPPGDR